MPNHNTYHHNVPLSWWYAIAWNEASPTPECEAFRKNLIQAGKQVVSYRHTIGEDHCTLNVQGE